MLFISALELVRMCQKHGILNWNRLRHTFLR